MSHTNIFSLSQPALGQFCLLAAERLLPIYEKFAEKFGLPSAELLAIHNSLFDLVISGEKIDVNLLSQRIDKLIPDTEDYSDALADQAQCSAICTSYCIDYLRSHDPEMANYAMEKVLESIDIYGYEGGETEEVVRQELDWQQKIVAIINKKESLSAEEIGQLRLSNRMHAIPSV